MEKATNLRARLLGSSNGHIHRYLNNYVTNLVPKLIDQHLQAGYRIEVRILEEIDYQDSSFSRAAHRLAFAELKWIVNMQKDGLCLEQLPEGAGPNSRTYWEKIIRIKRGLVIVKTILMNGETTI